LGEKQVAKVAISAATFAIDRPYDYELPPALAGRVQRGMRVLVPFGAGNRRTEGLVLSTEPCEGELRTLKKVLALLDEEPVLSEEHLQLALWMRERYFCTVYDAARAMLPAGLYFSLQNLVRLETGVDREKAFDAAGKSERAKQIIDAVFSRNGVISLGELQQIFGEKDPNPALKGLIDQKILVLDADLSRGIADKTDRVAVLAVPPEEAMALVTPKRRSAPLRYAVTELLATMGEASAKELCYFTGASMATMRSLAKSGILTLEQRESYRRPDICATAPPDEIVLTRQQRSAMDGLAALAAAGKPAAALLHGVTGSGKTQVYIRLIQEVLSQGKSAMVLVPEIVLTPQLMRIFSAHFGDQIAILHSALKAGERYDEWKRIRQGLAKVVIGTRSAVFAPLERIGVIILDEEQESSYKSEQVPRYHARDVAKFRCARHGALLVLGSATPSVETMYQAKQGRYHLFSLDQRYNRRSLPKVEIVDMRGELKRGNGGELSAELRSALEQRMAAGEQSILLLNRRGNSKMLTCGECGDVPTCPRCSAYLTYHSANHRLMCHHCGHSERVPECCPACGGRLQYIGAGTQKVQEELEQVFPDCEILRMDSDTISATQTHEKLLSRFEKEKIPILIGTQMVAKGLDFENVTLVGVLGIDAGLYVDDYRAGERVFSLITQVVGRAGRGSKTGTAVIQTFTPENDLITCAAAQDYDRFFEQEIRLRAARGCPPFRDLFVITVSGLDEAAVLRACVQLRRTFETWQKTAEFSGLQAEILGPAPANVAKINNRYRYHMTFCGRDTRRMRGTIAALVRCGLSDRNNRRLSITADINPINLS